MTRERNPMNSVGPKENLTRNTTNTRIARCRRTQQGNTTPPIAWGRRLVMIENLERMRVMMLSQRYNNKPSPIIINIIIINDGWRHHIVGTDIQKPKKDDGSF
eukprot:SAG31_NODE_3549_length_4134_cov_3.066171_2_plen_103_part_00